MTTQASVAVRGTLHLRNDAMLSAREQLGLTQREAATMCGVPLYRIQEFEKFDYRGGGAIVLKAAERVAGVYDLPLEKVLPPGLQGVAVTSRFTRCWEMPPCALLDAGANVGAASRTMALPAPDRGVVDEEYIEKLRESLSVAMDDLTHRERCIVRARFGLDGDALTFEEVGKAFKVTRERVRQIEAKAIRKLQHPDRARPLEWALDNEKA